MLAGIMATVVAGHYFFKRQNDKKLSAYVHIDSSVLRGIDPDVRNDLSVTYAGQPIRELHQLQFVIANDGERGIRCIEPPRLVLPPNVRLLNASILHRQPGELKASVTPTSVDSSLATATEVTMDFPVLNAGQFFVVKLLLDGGVSAESLTLHVTAEDLPQRLSLQPLPASALAKEPEAIDKTGILVSVLSLALGALYAYGVALVWQARPEIFPIPWESYRFHFLEFLLVFL